MTAAISRKGRLGPAAWPSMPPTAGPNITPTDEQVTDGPRRAGLPPPAASSISASQATPVVHTIPNAIPNAIRPASSSGSD